VLASATVTVFGYHQLAGGPDPGAVQRRVPQAEEGVVDYTAHGAKCSRDGSGDYGWWTLATVVLARPARLLVDPGKVCGWRRACAAPSRRQRGPSEVRAVAQRGRR